MDPKSYQVLFAGDIQDGDGTYATQHLKESRFQFLANGDG